MHLKSIIVCAIVLSLIGFDAKAQKYIDKKVKQPSYQNNTVGGGFSNYFKRLELEFGGSTIQSEYTYSQEGIDQSDNTYKIMPVKTETETKPLLHGGFNSYFPLSQPSLHRVYGLGLSGYVEFTDFFIRDELRLTNISLPIVFYSKFGADASFDSRTRYTWGWGLGYVPSLFNQSDTASTIVGYPIVYLEGGIFSTSSIKLRLSSNLGYKYRVDEIVDGVSVTPRSWLTSSYKIFPFRLSLIWTPGSIRWERNRWKK